MWDGKLGPVNVIRACMRLFFDSHLQQTDSESEQNHGYQNDWKETYNDQESDFA